MRPPGACPQDQRVQGQSALWKGSLWDQRQLGRASRRPRRLLGCWMGAVVRNVGRAGSVRKNQESNFYTVFWKTESRDNRDLMGVGAEVGKVPSCSGDSRSGAGTARSSQASAHPLGWPLAPGQLPEWLPHPHSPLHHSSFSGQPASLTNRPAAALYLSPKVT